MAEDLLQTGQAHREDGQEGRACGREAVTADPTLSGGWDARAQLRGESVGRCEARCPCQVDWPWCPDILSNIL